MPSQKSDQEGVGHLSQPKRRQEGVPAPGCTLCAPGFLTPWQMENTAVAGGISTHASLSLHFYGEGHGRVGSTNSTLGPPTTKPC